MKKIIILILCVLCTIFYSSCTDFDDIEACLKNRTISERSCSSIYRWNSEKGRENWNMEDVKEALGLGTMEYRSFKHNYLYNTLKQRKQL